MKILVITRNAWDDNNSIGNSISNFFSNVPDIEFANIYFRAQKPNNKLCKRYFRITEKDIIRNWFSPSKIGKCFTQDDHTSEATRDQVNEKKIISFVHKHNIKILYRFSNRLWNSQKWVNEKLDDFITSFSPDMVFSFVKAAPQYFQMISLLRKKYDVPLFTWIADDEYSVYQRKSKKDEIVKLGYILKESSVLRGCSKEICEYYNSIFGCNATPLYKGCDLSYPVKNAVGDPIVIIYAGNLLYGRLEILRNISDAVEKYSALNSKNVQFDIYSNTLLSEEDIQKNFGTNNCTRFLGKENYDVIKTRLPSADVLLHVESFEKEEILKTKYSFSTKIIDYLQSGSVIMAVGPSEVASMQYIRDIPGAFVVDEMSSLYEELQVFFNDSDNFYERARKSHEFALANHHSKVLSHAMLNILQQLQKLQ